MGEEFLQFFFALCTIMLLADEEYRSLLQFPKGRIIFATTFTLFVACVIALWQG